jgi:peptidoglycan/LPS O-acetylase OafA/YrhL
MPALDGLRGVAILLVVMSHAAGGRAAAQSIFHNVVGWAMTFGLPGWADRISIGTDRGVQLFFVISAFTLTVQAMRHRGEDLGRYALRRVARIGPAFWLAALFYALFAGLGPHMWAPHGIAPADMVLGAAFASAWQGGAAMAVVPGGWSISCEVAFYLALPLLIPLTGGRIPRAVLLTLVSLALAQARAWAVMRAGGWGFPAYIHPIEQAPAFCCGVTAALVALQCRLPRVRGLVAAVLAGAVIGLPLLGIPVWWALPNLPFAVLAAIAVAFAAAHPPAWLTGRGLRHVGTISYSLYLVHFAVLAPSLSLAMHLRPATDGITLLLHDAITLALSMPLASLTYAVIERPPIRWAARFTRPAPPVPATA